MTSVLYISYDGMLEPLGKSQVLRYLEGLAADYRIILISFEKPEDWADEQARAQVQSLVDAAGIHWLPLKYHKRPSALATAWDIWQGILVGSWVVRRHGVGLVHARSYVPSVMALSLKRLWKVKYLFDMRGFWADERVDGGLWPAGGWLYRMAKGFERRFLLGADCVVSLTEAAVKEMQSFPYLQQRMPDFRVITTCADLDLFRPADGNDAVSDRNDNASFVLGYVGSVGVWYDFDAVLRLFRILRESVPDARLHIINRGGHDYIRTRLTAHDIDPERVVVEETDHGGVAEAMRQMDAGVFFIKPLYSKLASAPTKLGEFLGCGVPCLTNAGVGDMAAILQAEQVGAVVEDFSDQALRKAVGELLALTSRPGVREQCRRAALRHFSLDAGIERYRHVYQKLIPNGGNP